MYLLDTNIIIYYFNNDIPDHAMLKIEDIFKNYFNISIITKLEFLGFKGHSSVSFEKSQAFLKNSNIIALNNTIAERVINLKRENSIKIPDAIIAATALEYDFTLVTRNVADFKDIPLKMYNPFDKH